MSVICKYKILGALVLFQVSNFFGQEGVGIGTENPKSILDIVSDDVSKGGILIPRFSADDLSTATFTDEQNSMLVYVLDAVSTPNTGITEYVDSAGFYYYDATIQKFIKLSGSNAPLEGWSIDGNIVTANNFIGTKNNMPLKIKVNNVLSGVVSPLNVSFGQNSLINMDEVGGAKNNVGLGFQTLTNLTTGDDNTAIGEQALSSITTGTDNIAVGQGAIKSLTTGRYNIGIGGRIMEGGEGNFRQNIGIGYDILNAPANSGGFNIGMGFQALKANVTGANNVSIGRGSSFKNISGQDNVTLGTQSYEQALSGDKNVIIGFKAGIKTTSGNENVMLGDQAGSQLLSGNQNIFIGHRAGNTSLTNLTGSNNIVIGTLTAPSSATASNEVTLGSDAMTSYRMWTNGWTTPSDIYYKNSIENLPIGLSFVTSLRPVEYIYNNETKKTKTFGFIAQEVNDLVKKSNLKNVGIVKQFDENRLGLRMNDFIPVLTKAIQEQQVIINNQQSEIDNLKKEIEVIKKMLTK